MTQEIDTVEKVRLLAIDADRPFFSATHAEITSGATSDIYFAKSYEILRHQGLLDTVVTAEIFARRPGLLAGTPEILNLLKGKQVEVRGLEEGQTFGDREVVMRISGAYGEFGLFETAILGFLAASSGWATAARRVKEAAGGRPLFCFGARHVHPAVAPVMERAAVVGGADGVSCILGAKLAGLEPAGTLPHSAILIMGDTVGIARVYHQLMPAGHKRVILVDTFRDEAEESLRVADALGLSLEGVRLDTPSELGGVTPDLVKEVRARLDAHGHHHVQILATGGLDPDRILALAEAGADAFGVGSYISAAAPVDMTMDIKEINGRPVAKRGRIPGVSLNNRLRRLI